MNKPFSKTKGRRLRIFKVPWHSGHDYELMMSIPNVQWNLLICHARRWADQNRPLPPNVKWVTNFDPKENDLAIINVDQQCVIPELGKSMLVRDMLDVIKGKCPIIVINHGTPCYPERFTVPDLRKKMKELIGDEVMIVNSHQAREEWGWGQTIIHGMRQEDWFDIPKEPRAVTFISQGGIGEKYYNRKLLVETKQILAEDYGIKHLWMCYETKGFTNWDEYKTFLGSSLVYFNPTFGSPMPRTRSEAQHSGCCIVTTKYHGADDFIEDGVNGFITKNNPESAAKIISDLILNRYREAVEIGQRGKETAKKIFSRERFGQDWTQLINKKLNIK